MFELTTRELVARRKARRQRQQEQQAKSEENKKQRSKSVDNNNNNKGFECKICRRMFQKKHYLLIHEQSHNNKGQKTMTASYGDLIKAVGNANNWHRRVSHGSTVPKELRKLLKECVTY